MKIFGKTVRPSEAPRVWDDCDTQLRLMRGLTYRDALGVMRAGDSWSNAAAVDGWERVDAANAAWRARLLADVDMCAGVDAGETGAGVLAAGFALTICLVTSVWLVNWFAAAMAMSA
jgi:hypothetical protein